MYGCVCVVRYGVSYLWYVCAVWGYGLPGMCGVCGACCMSVICGMALMCVKRVMCGICGMIVMCCLYGIYGVAMYGICGICVHTVGVFCRSGNIGQMAMPGHGVVRRSLGEAT